MFDVFISYSVKEQALAEFVRGHLVQHDLDVFLASLSLTPGEQWSPQILDALRQSEWVVLLASQNALASPNVQQEVGGALYGNKRLVPIIWDISPSDLPNWIASYQGLILRGATMENINLQMAQLAAHVKGDKLKGQLVAGAVIAGLLFLLSR